MAEKKDFVNLESTALKGRWPKLGLRFVNGRTQVLASKYEELKADPTFKKIVRQGLVGLAGKLRHIENPNVVKVQSGVSNTKTAEEVQLQSKQLAALSKEVAEMKVNLEEREKRLEDREAALAEKEKKGGGK